MPGELAGTLPEVPELNTSLILIVSADGVYLQRMSAQQLIDYLEDTLQFPMTSITDLDLTGLADGDSFKWNATEEKFVVAPFPVQPTIPINVGFYVPELPDLDSFLAELLIPNNCLLTEDMAGSALSHSGAVAEDTVITVLHNGVEIGTITIAATTGAVTFDVTETELDEDDLLQFKYTAGEGDLARISVRVFAQEVV